MIKLNKLAMLAGVAVVGSAAFSSSASASISTYACGSGNINASVASYNSYATSSCTTNATYNQASTTTTSTTLLKTASAQAAGLVSSRIASATSGAGSLRMSSNGFTASTGAAAGNHLEGYNLWASGSWSSVEDDNASTAYDGNVYTVMVGVDTDVNEDLLVGLALGYEDLDIDTDYNGFGGRAGNVDGNGWTIAPYLSYSIEDHLRANLVVGYSDVEYDTLRFDPNVGDRLIGSTEADRYFIDASVNGDYMVDDSWRLRSKLGVFYTEEEKDGFTETANTLAGANAGYTVAQGSQEAELGQVTLDAKLGYAYDVVEPYALIGLEWDFTKDEAAVAAGQSKASLDAEDFGAKFGAGLDLNLGDGVTGGIEAYTVEFRDEYEEYTATANIRVAF